MNKRGLTHLAIALVLVAAGCSSSDSILGVNEGRVRFVLSASSGTGAQGSAPVPPAGQEGSVITSHPDEDDRRFLHSANVTFSSILARNLDGVLVDVMMALPVTVEVLSMDGGKEVRLPDAILPPATYDQVVVVMTQVEVVTSDGTTIRITPPGGGWTAIVPICPFVVEAGETTTVGLTFMLEHAFEWRENRFHFQPRFVCEQGTDPLVVPDGELVYTRGGEAWLARFDGTQAKRLGFTVPSVREPSVAWSPDGARIVLGGNTGFVVYDLESETVSPSSWPGGTAGSDVIWPRFGPGGTIYYSSSDGQGEWDLRQMNPDGSSPAITIASARFPNNDFFPDWAPDGSQFVFTADWEERNRFLLRLSDPTVTTITTIDIEGVTHVWSPDGSLIAYQELGVVGVVAPDESISRSWDPGWSKGVTWSPQSEMLVGISGGKIAIIDVETGETLVLTHFGTGIDAVAWRPR